MRRVPHDSEAGNPDDGGGGAGGDGRGLRHRARVHARAGGLQGGRLGRRRRLLPAGAAGRSRSAGLQDCPRARDAGGRADVREPRAGVRGRQPARRGAAGLPQVAGVRTLEPAGGAARRRARADAPGSAGGHGAAAGDREAARAGAPPDSRADPEPGQPRSPQHPLHQRGHSRRPQFHRQCDRHQRYLRPRLPGSIHHAATSRA